jgi:threonine synthase
MSAYAALAGIEAQVFMPRDVPPLFIAECRALGAEVTLVDGLITDCGRVAAEGVRQWGRFDISTLKEPYRIEGKKTMGYEIAEQMEWTLPDVIIYPTGGGTGLVGMWKAFDEMEQLAWISPKRPRMVAVQSEGCAPMVRAFHHHRRWAARAGCRGRFLDLARPARERRHRPRRAGSGDDRGSEPHWPHARHFCLPRRGCEPGRFPAPAEAGLDRR